MSDLEQAAPMLATPESPKRRGRKPGARIDRANTQSLEARLRRFASLFEDAARELKEEADAERGRQTKLIDDVTKRILQQ